MRDESKEKQIVEFDENTIARILYRTPEQIAKEEAEQAQAKAAMWTRIKPNSFESLVIQGIKTVMFARTQLEVLDNSEEARVNQELERLSEGYAMQGLYMEASEICPNPEKAKRFRLIHEALERENDKTCPCDDDIKSDPLSGKQVLIQSDGIQEKVVDLRTRTVVPLIVCRKCGFMNAQPLNSANPKHALLALRESLLADDKVAIPDSDFLKAR